MAYTPPTYIEALAHSEHITDDDPSALTEGNAERHHHDTCEDGCVWCEHGDECPWCGDYLCWAHDPDTGLSQRELEELAEEHAQDRRDERWGSIDG